MSFKGKLRANSSARLISALSLSTTALSALAVAMPGVASAQVADPAASPPAAQAATGPDGNAPAQAQAQQSDVIVTGSRLGNSGFSAPTPTTVLGQAELTRQGQTTVASYLNEIPAFQPSNTPATKAITSLNGSGTYLDLRGLGSVRTLVLVDGHRQVPATQSGEVDISLIPQLMIKRVDVVTGGASAAYGSDAVAGVVNFVLDDTLEGFKYSLQSGISQRGDDPEKRAALAFGTSFASGRGHVSLSGELADSGGIAHQYDRAWGTTGYQLIANPLYVAGNGQPRMIITANSHQSNRTEGGLILSGPAAGFQFLPDGTLTPFVKGNPAGSTFMVGGSGINQGIDNPLVTPIKRQSALLLASYELTDHIRAKIEASYGASESQNNITQPFNTTASGYVIPAGNAFLSPAATAATGGQAFTLGRIDTDFGYIYNNIHIKSYQAIGSLEGDLGGSWKWSAYWEYGKTDYHGLLQGNVITSRLNNALDAKVSNGKIVCGINADANPANDDPACVPINVFGNGAPSAAAISYVTGTSINNITLRQDAGSAELHGNLFHTWAGPAAFATGFEYRRETAFAQVDALSQANAFLIGNPKNLYDPANPGKPASFNVKEGFVELGLPLLKDSALGRSLDLDAAARFTGYSTTGEVTTWKFGAVYAPIDGLKIRVTRSRDIRAPNLNELYTPPRTNFTTVIDRTHNNATSTIPVYTIGNTALVPETANTFTGGVVAEPRFIPGLRLSVDYFKIDISNAINTLTAQQIVDRCAGGATALCGFIARDGTGAITSVSAAFFNLAKFQESGIDIEAAYTIPFGSGRIATRALATYIDHLILNDGVVSIDRAGENGPNNLGLNNPGAVPHWRANANVAYLRGPFNFSLTGRYIGSGNYDNTYVQGVDINNNHVNSRFYLDTAISYRFQVKGGRSAELFGAVNNLLDKDPPIDPTSFQNSFVTNQALYDVVGRAFVIGIRGSF